MFFLYSLCQNFCCIILSHYLVAGIHDAPHTHESHTTHAHAHEVPVLSRLHVPHPSSEVGLLIHKPVAIHHIAGHEVGHSVAVHDAVAVLHQLMHLALEVLPFIDPHPVGSSVHGDHAAGPDAITHAKHAHVISILAPPHEVLVSHVVGAVIDHEAAPLHLARVTAAQVGGHVWAVTHALIGAALEIPLLVEDDPAHCVHATGGHLSWLLVMLLLLLERNCLPTCWQFSLLYMTARGPLCQNNLTQQYSIEAYGPGGLFTFITVPTKNLREAISFQLLSGKSKAYTLRLCRGLQCK